MLRASEAEITAEVEALPNELLSWHPEPGEWCVNECLGHLIEAEKRGFAGRVRVLLQPNEGPALTSWDQVGVARARNDCATDANTILSEFGDERAASVVLVTSLQPDDLSRGGDHPQVGHRSEEHT